MKTVRDIFNFVFSGYGLTLIAFGLLAWLLILINSSEEQQREQTRQRIEACYNFGMVLVNTDAGQRCADPKSLVKVK